MSYGFELLGKMAIAKTAPGEMQGKGIVIGYCGVPTVTIEQDDGSRIRWRADLCTFHDVFRCRNCGKRISEYPCEYCGIEAS